MAGVGKLLKQAQKMQKAMESVQTELANLTVEGSAAGGAVKATVTGHPEFLKEDIASVEESIVAAVEDATSKARAKSEAEMNKITGGFSIPGLM